MTEGILSRKEGAADFSAFATPVLALTMWRPLLTGAVKCNAQANEGIGALASEWQKFLNGRLKEDVAFIERVGQSRTTDQFWAAYVGFWQKAADDYGKECIVMGRLMAGVTSNTVKAAQSAAEEVRADMLQPSRAA